MGTRLRVVRSVAAHPLLCRLEAAFTGFSIAEHARWISTLVYAYEHGGVSQSGEVAFAMLGPAMLVAPFAAYAVDRFRRDSVLAFGYGAQAAATAATAVAMQGGSRVAVVYIFAGVSASLVTVARPAMGALLPFVTDTSANLAAANVVMGIAENSGIFVGPMTAAMLLDLASPALVFAVMAATMALCALLVIRLPGDRGSFASPRGRRQTGVWGDVIGGFEAMGQEP